MNVIMKTEMNLERLQQLFQSEGYGSQIVVLSPAAPDLGLDRDAYLKVDSPECPSLIVWFDILVDSHLRMRILISSYKERCQFNIEDIEEYALEANQNIIYFGAICPQGPGPPHSPNIKRFDIPS